jgi:hypothetical protein
METTHLSQPASSLPSTVKPSNAPAVVNRQVMLSTQQDQALEWLMNGGSITEAAQFAGVARQTVSRWLHSDEDFRAVYDAWRDQVTNITEGQLMGLSEAAVSTLANAVRDRQNVKAAEFVIKHLATLKKHPQAAR